MSDAVEIAKVVAGIIGGGAVAGLGSWYLKLRADRHTQKLEDADFWVKHSEQEFQRLQTVIDSLHRELAACQANSVQLSANIAQLKVQLEAILVRYNLATTENIQLRLGLPPMGLADEWLACVIVARSDGLIIQASPTTALVFQWFDRELIGKNVEDLIPKRHLEKHRQGWKRFLATGVVPDSRKSYRTDALTQSGAELPVEIQLTAWRGPENVAAGWLVGAVIRQAGKWSQIDTPGREGWAWEVKQ